MKVRLSKEMRNWNIMEFYNVRKVVDAWANEIELLETLVLEESHLPRCPQFTGPYDLGELEPACTCGYEAIQSLGED